MATKVCGLLWRKNFKISEAADRNSGGVRINALSISSHEQMQLNRICCFYLRRFSESRSSSGYTPSVRLFIRSSVRPQHFWGA